MFHSRSFIAQAQKIRKHAAGDGDEFVRRLAEQFSRQLSHLPRELSSELFDHCMATRSDTDQRVQALGDILDLMYQQYDEAVDPLLPADWQLLRDIIDQFAADLDMAVVQYVMERVVSHHAL
jgi:hypothetical protein